MLNRKFSASKSPTFHIPNVISNLTQPNEIHLPYKTKDIKNYQILFLMIIGILISCNKNDDEINLETEIIGSWKLMQITGSIPNSEMFGNEM